MSSIGRSCERGAEAAANFIEGVNQRLDENHLIDMIVTLKDEEISIDEFKEFTTTVKDLRNSKKVKTTATNP